MSTNLIQAAIERHGSPKDIRVWEYALYLLDQRPVQLETKLYEGAELKVLWKVFGG